MLKIGANKKIYEINRITFSYNFTLKKSMILVRAVVSKFFFQTTNFETKLLHIAHVKIS